MSPRRVDANLEHRAGIDVGIEVERMVVAIGADITWILNATPDVEVGLAGRDAILASPRSDPAHDAVDPHVGIARDMAGLQIIVGIVVPVGANTVPAVGRQVPG